MSEELKLSLEQQIALMEKLHELYECNMEGEDHDGFVYWEALANAAHTILEAMKKEYDKRGKSINELRAEYGISSTSRSENRNEIDAGKRYEDDGAGSE